MRARKRSSATLERQGQDRGGGSPFALQRAGFWGPCKVVRPCGERRTHRSGEGCPQCNGGSARLKRRLRPTSRRRLPLERICAPYGFVFLCQQKNNICIQRSQASGVSGFSPSVFCIWGPRRIARPVGERRSGGALEGCLFRRNSDPTWSAARDDAHEQKEVPAG